MKTYNRYITLAAMALTFAACSQDEDFALQTDGDAVKINATIGTMPQTRLTYGTDGTTTFQSGDQIRVINQTRSGQSKSDAAYKFDGSDWAPATATKYVVWEGTDANTFYGVHPAKAEYTKFTIPEDQDTDDLLTAADWMTATHSGTQPQDGTINLAFQHRLTKVTVKLTKWNNEFDNPDNVTIDYPKIYSMGTVITASYSQDATTGTTTATIVSDKESIGIDPLVGGTDPYPTYTVIVAPNAKYAASDEFMTFDIDYDTFTVLAKAKELTDGLQPGKHYTFDLTVGKEKAEISSVAVTDWTPQTIDGGVAETSN